MKALAALCKAPAFGALAGWLSAFDMLQLAQTCRLLSESVFGAAADEIVWRPHTEREFAAVQRLEEGARRRRAWRAPPTRFIAQRARGALFRAGSQFKSKGFEKRCRAALTALRDSLAHKSWQQTYRHICGREFLR